MKLIIDIPDEEYTTLSKMSEKEKVNELSYYERAIANGIPYEERQQGEWIDVKDIPYLANCSNCGYQMDTHEERGYFKFCPSCGADMRGKKNE